MFSKRNRVGIEVQRLETDLAVIQKQGPSPDTMQFQLCYATDASPRFEVRWKSAGEHVKGTEHRFTQSAQQLTVTQAKRMQEASHLRMGAKVMLTTQDMVPDQCSLVTNARRVRKASL